MITECKYVFGILFHWNSHNVSHSFSSFFEVNLFVFFILENSSNSHARPSCAESPQQNQQGPSRRRSSSNVNPSPTSRSTPGREGPPSAGTAEPKSEHKTHEENSRSSRGGGSQHRSQHQHKHRHSGTHSGGGGGGSHRSKSSHLGGGGHHPHHHPKCELEQELR